jgi:hypothetical protein
MLRAEDVLFIYRCKLEFQEGGSWQNVKKTDRLRQTMDVLLESRDVRISEKNVRDIWTRKTWVSVTKPLWDLDKEIPIVCRRARVGTQHHLSDPFDPGWPFRDTTSWREAVDFIGDNVSFLDQEFIDEIVGK